MIILPPNVRDKVIVDLDDKRLVLFLCNEHRQYFTLQQPLDKALSLDENLARLTSQDLSDAQAYVVTDDMTTQFEEAKDQDWHPLPVPLLHNIASLKQYEAMQRLGGNSAIV